MPISLRRYPFLVQKEIIQQMSLQEAVFLSTTSKRLRLLVKYCLRRQQFHIEYRFNNFVQSVAVFRKHGTEVFDKMNVISTGVRPLREKRAGPDLKFLNHNVQVEFKKAQISKFHGFSQSITQYMNKVYQYLMDMFSKATIRLVFLATDGEVITRTMMLAEVNEVQVGPFNGIDLTMAQAALNGCANTKKLRILTDCSPVGLNPESRFEMDYVYIEDGDKWIYRTHLIRNFLNCKQVILPHTRFGMCSGDYPDFVKSWIKGSRMELLRVGGRYIGDHKIARTVGVLPGAIEVRRARVWEESKDRVFAAGCCYMVQQANGTRAIVVWSRREFFLTTKFEVLKDVDDDNKDNN